MSLSTKILAKLKVKRKPIMWMGVFAFSLMAMGYGGLQAWYVWYQSNHPINLSRYEDRGALVLSHDGSFQHMFAAKDGLFRLKADVTKVDKRYLDTLIAFEDKRFYGHSGVDYLALMRATGQAIYNGRVISGGSTITMQVARLLEPRPRTWRSKLIEMARADQLEERYSKEQILGLYLTLAPFGGAYEGVRAASWHYFGREPLDLTWGEAALLTVLPQSPTVLRPDRHPEKAARARDKVLARVQSTLGISPADLAANKGFRLRLKGKKDGMVSASTALHLAFRLRQNKDAFDTVKTTLNANYQQGATDIIRRAVDLLPKGMTAAAVIVDSWTGDTITYIGSPNYFDIERAGAVDMVTAKRSPGSTLKPFIYGLGFDDGFLHPLSLISDEKTRFGDYAPRNFRGRFHGEVSVQYALQHSLNIPAVKVLSRVGAPRFAAELAGVGVTLDIPGNKDIGLALALGGAGISLEDLVRLYAALASDGKVRPASFKGHSEDIKGKTIASATTRAYLHQILKGVSPPADLMPSGMRRHGRKIAFKTGTSWGFRDALSIGFDNRWVIGVWVGKPNGTPNPGHFGARTAAPILFDLFAMMPKSEDRQIAQVIQPSDRVKTHWRVQDLSPLQKHFDRPPLKYLAANVALPPVIQFPVPDSALKLPKGPRKLLIETKGGEGALSLLVNGEPVSEIGPLGRVWWQPSGIGFHRLTVVDERGQSAQTTIRILP